MSSVTTLSVVALLPTDVVLVAVSSNESECGCSRAFCSGGASCSALSAVRS